MWLIKNFTNYFMAHHICLKYFMITTKTLWRPSYILNVWSLMFSFFLSHCYILLAHFIKTNSPLIIFKSIKPLEINTSILFNLNFASNTILPGFFFVNYWLLVISIGIPSKEAKTEIDMHPVILEAKARKISK